MRHIKSILLFCIFLICFTTAANGIILEPNKVQFSLGSGWEQDTQVNFLTPTGNIANPSANQIFRNGEDTIKTIGNKGFGTQGNLYISPDWEGSQTDLDEDHLYASPNLCVEGTVYSAMLITSRDIGCEKDLIVGGMGTTVNVGYILPGSTWAGFVHQNLLRHSDFEYPIINPKMYAIKQSANGKHTYVSVLGSGVAGGGANSSIDFTIGGKLDYLSPVIRVFADGFVGMGIGSDSKPSPLDNTKLKVYNGNIEMGDDGQNSGFFARKETAETGFYGLTYFNNALKVFSPDNIIFAKKNGSSFENKVWRIDNYTTTNYIFGKMGIVEKDLATTDFNILSLNLDSDVRLFTQGHLIIGGFSSGKATGPGTKLWLRGSGYGEYKNSPVWLQRYNEHTDGEAATQLRICVGSSQESQLAIGWDDGTFHQEHRITATGHSYQSSDKRLKKDVEPVTNAIKDLVKLTPVKYYLKNSPRIGNKKIGLIAQEVEKVFPEMVHTNSQGFKSINYNSLIPVLVEAIKAQDKEIETYRKKLDELLKEISDF